MGQDAGWLSPDVSGYPRSETANPDSNEQCLSRFREPGCGGLAALDSYRGDEVAQHTDVQRDSGRHVPRKLSGVV